MRQTEDAFTRSNNNLQDAMRRAEHLRLINEVSCTITSILSLDELLRAVVISIQRTFGYYYVGLSLVEGNNLVIKASAGKYSPYIHPEEITLPIGHGSCIGHCAGENRPILAPDVRLDQQYRWFKELMESKSLIAVPLRFKGEVIGVLSAESDEVAAFDEADLLLLESLGNHVAIAVVNAHTYRQARRHAGEVTALLEMAQDLNSHLELGQLLRRLTERAINLTRAEAGVVFLIEGERLIGHDLWTSGDWQVVDWHLRLDDGRVENVLETSSPLIISSGDCLLMPPIWQGAAARSALLVPIHNRSGSPVGLIYLCATDPDRPFLPEDTSLVTALANQAAIALENARLYALEREKVERLRELERLKSNFLSSVSHDLRTPLTALKTCSEALLQLSLGEEMSMHRQLIQNINRNVERMAALVSDILEMASLQSGSLRLNYERMELNEVLKDMQETIRPLTEEKGQTLRFYLTQHPCTVMADRRRLEQVLMNLLSNAHRYTPQGGIIEVGLTEQGDHVLISVSDNGPGIPPDEQERIFEQFYRLSQGGRERAQSKGLGLSIARSLVELHGGRIWVQSPLPSSENGAAFLFTLPKEVPNALSHR